MIEHGRVADAWLFLTPEIEREVPRLVGDLEGDPAVAGIHRARIEALVDTGAPADWFAYLRELEPLVERHREWPAAERLAAILLEQYLLAPGVPPHDLGDPDGERRLRGLCTT